MKKIVVLFSTALLFSGCEHTGGDINGHGSPADITIIGSQNFSHTALVIGNGNYNDKQGKLTNPVNDARAMYRKLKSLGFKEVVLVTDGNLTQMKNAITEFGNKLRHSEGDDVAVFYYSGHGTYGGGSNYLYPIFEKGRAPDGYELGKETIADRLVLEEMGEHNRDGINVFILEACRNNPWSARSGLTPEGLMSAKRSLKNAVTALAAGEGETVPDRPLHSNSLYTEKLLNALEHAKEKRITEVFDEVKSSVETATEHTSSPQHPEHVYGGTEGDQICFGGCSIDG